MMKQNLTKILYVGSGIFSLIAIVGCTPPHSESGNGAPTKAMATATNSDLKVIGEGHAIYMRQCSQCHEAELPSSIPSDEWHEIVQGMASDAGLSKEEEDKVHSYIVAASKYNEIEKSKNPKPQ
jgi:mono/diheme cytochrome c family protein